MEQETTTQEAPKKGNNMPIVIAVIVLILAVGGVFLFQSMKSKQQQPSVESATQVAPTAMTSMAPASDSAMSANTTMQADQSSPIAVEGGNYYFKPNQIKVKKGDTVKITFTNKEGFHDFAIDAFKVKSNTIGAGKSETVSFVADKAGTYEFYCSVGNHRAMGMKGTLVVQ